MGYNLAGFNVTPQLITTEIQKHIPSFQISYKPDHRQDIADSWTESIDDSYARNDWNWKPKYNLQTVTIDMLQNIPLLKNS